MKIIFQKGFEERYKKLPSKIRIKVKERNLLFTQDQFSPILNNHPLHGKYIGYRSINIMGNLRAIYKELGNNTFLFVEIGTHSELYEK